MADGGFNATYFSPAFFRWLQSPKRSKSAAWQRCQQRCMARGLALLPVLSKSTQPCCTGAPAFMLHLPCCVTVAQVRSRSRSIYQCCVSHPEPHYRGVPLLAHLLARECFVARICSSVCVVRCSPMSTMTVSLAGSDEEGQPGTRAKRVRPCSLLMMARPPRQPLHRRSSTDLHAASHSGMCRQCYVTGDWSAAR